MSTTPRTDLNCLTVETLRTMKGTGTKIVLAVANSNANSPQRRSASSGWRRQGMRWKGILTMGCV